MALKPAVTLHFFLQKGQTSKKTDRIIRLQSFETNSNTNRWATKVALISLLKKSHFPFFPFFFSFFPSFSQKIPSFETRTANALRTSLSNPSSLATCRISCAFGLWFFWKWYSNRDLTFTWKIWRFRGNFLSTFHLRWPQNPRICGKITKNIKRRNFSPQCSFSSSFFFLLARSFSRTQNLD